MQSLTARTTKHQNMVQISVFKGEIPEYLFENSKLVWQCYIKTVKKMMKYTYQCMLTHLKICVLAYRTFLRQEL